MLPPNPDPTRRPAQKEDPVLMGLNEAGFSLIELISVMILLGIAGSMASLGLVTFIKSFTATKDTNYTAGKAQMAMLRMIKEMTAIETVTSATASAITFTSRHGPNSSDLKTYTLSLSGGNLILNDGTNSDVLTDQVSAFSLSYAPDFDSAPTSSWTGCTNPLSLSLVNYYWYSTANAYHSDNTLDVDFTDTNSTHLSDYRLSYGNPTYGTAGWSSSLDYTMVNVSSSSKSYTASPRYYYPKAYIWSVARGRNCYVAIDIHDANNAGVNYGGDGPPAILSRLINVTLTMQGANNTPATFTTRVFPRNI